MAVDEQQQHGGVKKGVKEEDLKLYSQRLAVPRLESLPPCAWVHAQVRRAVRLCAQVAPGCRVRTFSINTHDARRELLLYESYFCTTGLTELLLYDRSYRATSVRPVLQSYVGTEQNERRAGKGIAQACLGCRARAAEAAAATAGRKRHPAA